MLNSLLELYASKGISLNEQGIKEAVLPIRFAQEVLQLLINKQILILGGDLYKKIENGSFEPTYESWFYDGNNLEDSVKKATQFLQSVEDKSVYVSFVLQI